MLKKSLRLRQKLAYRRIFSEGTAFPGKYVVIYILDGEKKYGFIASRKVGNAVQRNRAKRLMREVVRLNGETMLSDKQMIFIARPAIKQIAYDEAEKSILNILYRIKKNRDGKQ